MTTKTKIVADDVKKMTDNEAIHALGNGDVRTGWAVFNS